MRDDKTAREAAGIVKKLATSDRRTKLLPPDFFGMLLEQIGGPRAFSRQVADLLNNVATPPMIRQRIITDLLRLMTHIEQKSALPPDLSDIPTDELESMLAEVLERINAPKAEAARPDGHTDGPEPGAGMGPAAAGQPA